MAPVPVVKKRIAINSAIPYIVREGHGPSNLKVDNHATEQPKSVPLNIVYNGRSPPNLKVGISVSETELFRPESVMSAKMNKGKQSKTATQGEVEIHEEDVDMKLPSSEEEGDEEEECEEEEEGESESESNTSASEERDVVDRKEYEALTKKLLKRDKEFKAMSAKLDALIDEKKNGPFRVQSTRGKRVASSPPTSQSPIKMGNRFEALDNKRFCANQDYNTGDELDNDADGGDDPTPPACAAPAQGSPAIIAKPLNANHASSSPANAASAQKKGSPKADSPEFLLTNLPAPAFERAMREKNIKVSARMLPTGVQKVTCDFEHRETVKGWMKENNVHGTTRSCNHERIGASIAKGIDIDYTPEEVREFLEMHVDFKIATVRRFKEKEDGVKPFHWWVITTENRDQIKELHKIKWFQNTFFISWEPYVSKRCPRCYNCQQYKHLARNCFKIIRCSKCKSSHDQRECPRPTPSQDATLEEMAQYYCVPCGERGHWAGWNKCPKFLEHNEEYSLRAKEQISNTRKAIKNRKFNQTSAPWGVGGTQPRQVDRLAQDSRDLQRRPPTYEDFEVTSKKMAAKVPRPVHQQPAVGAAWGSNRNGVSTGNKGNAWATINDETDDLFGMSPTDMIMMCSDFVARTRSLGKVEKKAAYVDFYLHIAQCGR